MKTKAGGSSLSTLALAAVATMAPAQEKSYDALARPRARAKAENQRVLLLLQGGEVELGAALTNAMADYRALGKLLRYEYQVVALPAVSRPARALRSRLRLPELALPALVVLDTDDAVRDTMGAAQMVANEAFAADRVRSFLQRHACTPLHARRVLAAGLADAKRSGRHAFVYLSAPW